MPITHAMIIPMPVSNLMTWCGQRCADAGPEDFVASAPEAVTCERCMRAMRDAQKNLAEWIPKLSVKEPTHGQP